MNSPAIKEIDKTLRMAARALPRHGLGMAFGHVSIRLSGADFRVCAAKALNSLFSGDAGETVAIDGDLPGGVLGEVRLHQQIYKARPDVGGIVRTFPPRLLTLSAMGLTPKARTGFGSYFAPCPPLWMNTALVRDTDMAANVAHTLGSARAIVLRGNGCVVTGTGIEEAVAMTWLLESAAMTELAVLGTGDKACDLEMDEDEVAARATTSGAIIERLWDYLTHGDPEK